MEQVTMTSTNNRAALLVAVVAAMLAALIAVASTGVFANNAGAQEAEPQPNQGEPAPVSYTHLTLPTILLV